MKPKKNQLTIWIEESLEELREEEQEKKNEHNQKEK